jgi:formate/nitrite transporter
MSYVKPPEIAKTMVAAGTMKCGLPPKTLVLRGMLAGAYLGVATSMAVTAAVQTGLPIVGAIIFPFGLCLVVLLGTELLTGSFALLPCATAEGKPGCGWGVVVPNWCWVFLGNLLGSVVYAALFAMAASMSGALEVSAVGAKVAAIAEAKTIKYAAHGGAGMATVFAKAVLCNWLVSLAVVMSFSTTTVASKMLAMWGPVMLFFSQGYEHAVVNMFMIPAGMMLGADVSMGDWWVWNQIPVTLGNLVGGLFFTGWAIYMTHHPKSAEEV